MKKSFLIGTLLGALTNVLAFMALLGIMFTCMENAICIRLYDVFLVPAGPLATLLRALGFVTMEEAAMATDAGIPDGFYLDSLTLPQTIVLNLVLMAVIGGLIGMATNRLLKPGKN